jgi:protein-tyrosine phosphatase
VSGGSGPRELLLVCTGNVCRTPLAEAFLRSALESRSEADAVAVSSAGTAGWEGSPPTAESVTAAAERRLDISGHRARMLRPEHVDAADVVVCMAERHVEEVAALAPGAATKTFTLKELVALLERAGTPDGDGLGSRVDAAARLRASGGTRAPDDPDVLDPLGMPLDAYRAVAAELEALCDRLAAALTEPAHAAASSRRRE